MIRNYGENLIILDIYEVSDSRFLNTEGMKTWFPYHFDKNTEINIPLLLPPTKIQALRMQIQCRNRLGMIYMAFIEITNGKPFVKTPTIDLRSAGMFSKSSTGIVHTTSK